MFRNKKIVAYSVITFLLLVAMLPIPSVYYHVLRIAVTVASVFAFYNLIAKSNLLWIDFAILTIVFNPLVPMPLTREVWIIVDLIAILAFIRLILTERKMDRQAIINISKANQ